VGGGHEWWSAREWCGVDFNQSGSSSLPSNHCNSRIWVSDVNGAHDLHGHDIHNVSVYIRGQWSSERVAHLPDSSDVDVYGGEHDHVIGAAI
jgi:hypothetical protein